MLAPVDKLFLAGAARSEAAKWSLRSCERLLVLLGVVRVFASLERSAETRFESGCKLDSVCPLQNSAGSRIAVFLSAELDKQTARQMTNTHTRASFPVQSAWPTTPDGSLACAALDLISIGSNIGLARNGC